MGCESGVQTAGESVGVHNVRTRERVRCLRVRALTHRNLKGPVMFIQFHDLTKLGIDYVIEALR